MGKWLSSTCLADFDSILPLANADYWIRLNKAAEFVDEQLQNHGIKVENLEYELAMMFMRHCPDPALKGIFKFRPARKWTMKEIQKLLYDHPREQRSQTTPIAGLNKSPISSAIKPQLTKDSYHLGTVSADARVQSSASKAVSPSVPQSDSTAMDS